LLFATIETLKHLNNYWLNKTFSLLINSNRIYRS